MMRIQLFSDLHLERDPTFRPCIAPDTDVIVLAGDIGSYQPGSRLHSSDFGLELFSPALGAPCPTVLFVPGNHEFDSLDFAETTERLRASCARLGITWLDQQVVTIGNVRFMGTTLWSDFDALATRELDPVKQLSMRNKAMRAANYYLSKNTTLTDGAQVLAEGLREMSLACQAWLRAALATPFDGKTVVVTHFAPTLLSADPRYGLAAGTAGFCNSLDALLPLADVWMHGHLHCMNDYVVEDKGTGKACRVVANPLGYLSKNEQVQFREHLVIEV
jgi:predicted phosphodiesterase